MSIKRKSKPRVPAQTISGVGQWVIRNSKFYDPVKRMYIIRCKVCERVFYAKRVDAVTCSDGCKQERYRQNREADDLHPF